MEAIYFDDDEPEKDNLFPTDLNVNKYKELKRKSDQLDSVNDEPTHIKKKQKQDIVKYEKLKELKRKVDKEQEETNHIKKKQKQDKIKYEEDHKHCLNAKFNKSKIFKNIIDSIKEFASEVDFEWTEDGLKIRTMDNANVSVIILDLPNNWFDSYVCDRPFTIGLHLDTISKIIPISNNDNMGITIKYIDESDYIEILIDSSKVMKEFQIKTITIEGRDKVLPPDVEFDCVTYFKSKDFKDYCQDAQKMTSENIKIIASNKTITFEFNGQGEMVKGNFKHERNDHNDTYNNDVTLSFSSLKLLACTKATSVSDKLKLSISKEFPLLLDYIIEGKDGNTGYLQFFIAPKMDNV